LLQVVYAGDFKSASKSVEKVWAGINPGLKVEVRDFENEMGMLYEIFFGTMVRVLGFMAFLAIVISCLGLLGMATYTIQTRKKEIAIRKILGSSNRSLVYHLSKGFIAILVMALLISVPVAYFLNTSWLQELAYHVSVDFTTVMLGALVLTFFGLFTIASQTLQAIVINPVDNLKNE
jgi:putative ABC transport system permease protein